MTFSARLPDHTRPNAVTMAVASLDARGITFVDLTASNPTRAGLAYPDGLLDALGARRAMTYVPEPLGLLSARQAVAADAARRGAAVDPKQVVLTASTSEAYSWLFKLLCNPGDAVLVPQPSYPLFDHLTRLESVQAFPYALEYHGRWSIDFARIEAAPATTRAVLVVSPNNPTGSYVSAAEVGRLAACCRERGWALIADEVFADFPLEETAPLTDLASRLDVLTFTLGGASKSLGLPQVKLGWIVCGGAPEIRADAIARLELIADTFLSVGTPVQVAAPVLLRDGAVVRAAVHARVRANLAQAHSAVRAHPACEVLRTEGGWSAVIRVPALRTEDELVLDLLQQERVLVHPGYFFDFGHEAFIVVSLLPPEDVFADAIARVVRFAAQPPTGRQHERA